MCVYVYIYINQYDTDIWHQYDTQYLVLYHDISYGIRYPVYNFVNRYHWYQIFRTLPWYSSILWKGFCQQIGRRNDAFEYQMMKESS